MRSLTIQQPWLHAIMSGAKTVENRTWPAPAQFIGHRIALHAGKTYDYESAFPAGTVTPGWEPGELPEGAVAAVATVAECHYSADCMLPLSAVPPGCRAGCSPWAVRGQYHWVLTGVSPLPEPVSCRGMLGLWKLPEDVENAVRAQLSERAV